MERLSYLTIACGDPDKAKTVAKNLSGNYIKTKITDDIIGTEYAAMLKNIYAIAGITAWSGMVIISIGIDE
jgi:glycerol-3-phosphate dehydrogenase (NAD(P)+)